MSYKLNDIQGNGYLHRKVDKKVAIQIFSCSLLIKSNNLTRNESIVTFNF